MIVCGVNAYEYLFFKNHFFSANHSKNSDFPLRNQLFCHFFSNFEQFLLTINSMY